MVRESGVLIILFVFMYHIDPYVKCCLFNRNNVDFVPIKAFFSRLKES